jgi:dTDP-4-dehydrorhamnose 3,5-epimerase
MRIIQGDIPGLLIFEPQVFIDERGSFTETYNTLQLAALGFSETFLQDNQSASKKHVVRALHFQHPPMAQGKLVRVARGSVIDVAVDIRRGSPHYGHHQKVFLSDENQRMFWIPPGFAHGFISLEEHTVFCYKCTNVYSKEHEGAIRWDDPDLNIDWGTDHPVVSARDAAAPLFRELQSLFTFDTKG